MMTDVSVEALEKVKESVKHFGESVEKISADIISQNETVIEKCKNVINDTKKELDVIIKIIQTLDHQIYEKEYAISYTNDKIDKLENQITLFQNKLMDIESTVSKLKQEREYLKSQLRDADDEEIKKQIQQQIDEVQKDISNFHIEESELKGKERETTYQIEELQSKISSLKSEIVRLEQERNREKVRKEKISSKLERMSRVFSTLRADLMEYTNAVKKFESKSTSNIGSNISSINKCITAIEEYFLINL